MRKDSEIISYVEAANNVLGEIGYTEHGMAHVVKTGEDASRILKALGYGERECELAKIAGLMHDIGNMINRCDHAQSGAFLAFELLRARNFPVDEVIKITTAIGHHDEKTAAPVTPLRRHSFLRIRAMYAPRESATKTPCTMTSTTE